MRQLIRLVRYALPYWWQIFASVVLMAAVGALDAFKYLLVRPVFDRVLNPASGSKDIQLFIFPGTHHVVYLQQFVPSRITNAWSAVAFALVASTILKGICDYTGTYLGEPRRVWHDHRPARRFVQRDHAPLGGFFFKTYDGNIALRDRQ